MTGWLATFRWRVGDRVFGDALVGRDGWFFLADEPSMQGYQRNVGLRTALLTSMQTELDDLNARLRARGVTLVVIVAPDKSSIYPEYMPREVKVADRGSRLDDFVAFMRVQGQARVIDLRPALLAARGAHQLYYQTDSHWNDLGAYFASAVILDSLAAEFPALKPRPLSDFDVGLEEPGNRDLPRISRLWWLEEAGPVLTPRQPTPTSTIYVPLSSVQDMWFTRGEDASLPRLLVFRDSFYFWLAKFIEPHFSSSTVVHYNRLGESSTLDDWIDQARPDIVILETTERSLLEVLPVLEERRSAP